MIICVASFNTNACVKAVRYLNVIKYFHLKNTVIHVAVSLAVLNKSTSTGIIRNISYIWADITLNQFQYCFRSMLFADMENMLIYWCISSSVYVLLINILMLCVEEGCP